MEWQTVVARHLRTRWKKYGRGCTSLVVVPIQEQINLRNLSREEPRSYRIPIQYTVMLDENEMVLLYHGLWE